MLLSMLEEFGLGYVIKLFTLVSIFYSPLEQPFFLLGLDFLSNPRFHTLLCTVPQLQIISDLFFPVWANFLLRVPDGGRDLAHVF